MLLALAGCADAPPPPPVQPAPAPAASAPPPNSADLVEWDENDSATIACPLTETRVEVPEAWRAHVRRISESEVVIEPTRGHSAVIMVRGADHRLTTGEGIDDMRRLFELARVPTPKQMPESSANVLNQEILPRIPFIDVDATPFEFEQEPPGTGTVVIGYRVVVAKDATCRLATVVPKSDPIAQQLAAFLDAADTPRPEFDPSSISLIYPAKTPKVPPASCKGWPVWMFPVCRVAAPPPKASR